LFDEAVCEEVSTTATAALKRTCVDDHGRKSRGAQLTPMIVVVSLPITIFASFLDTWDLRIYVYRERDEHVPLTAWRLPEMRSGKKGKNGPSAGARQRRQRGRKLEAGYIATGGSTTLRSYAVGGLPLINHILRRMRLQEILDEQLPADDPRVKLPTSRALLVLVRNVLMSREPIYGVAEWAQRYAPDLLDLWPEELEYLTDDCLGRCLARFFESVGPSLVLAVVRQVISEFRVRLDELHNDSTTVTFYGAYAEAEEEGRRRGRPTHAITWGHNKDHRPDLKQLLYILTVSDDGGVPVYFTSASGNVVDDKTHCQTWDLLRELVQRPDFLYVADCKLATTDNMNYIAQRGGRFVSVLPRSRKEDTQFRERLRQTPQTVTWQHLYDVTDQDERLLDRFQVCADEAVSAEGYRLLWFQSTRKAELDATTRSRRIQRALAELSELRDRVHGPRTRFRQRQKVEDAVQKILEERSVERWVKVQIDERQQATYRQTRPGRPNKHTPYRKQVTTRYTFSWQIDTVALMAEESTDGVFPLISNAPEMDAEQLLRAYKRQPIIEKRFSQLKTEFAVTPVHLKEVSRIQGLLAVYFLALLVQTLLERELRQAMERQDVSSLPLYPEGRPCQRPTAARVLEAFGNVQRHVLTRADGHDEFLITELSPLQRKILRLLGISPDSYGR
jgi:transposase